MEPAQREGVDVRLHTIIYELLDELKKAAAGLLAPVIKETHLGRAEMRDDRDEAGVAAGPADRADVGGRRVVLGGGVLQHPGLIDQVRRQVSGLLNGYIQSDWLGSRIEEYIVSPGLGNRAGVLGAVAMAMVLEEEKIS